MTDTPSTWIDINSPTMRVIAARDPDRALDILKRALQLDPKNLGAWLNYAGLLRRSGQADAALDAVNHALDVEPRSFHGLLMKGSILEAQGDLPNAGRSYAVALVFAPPQAELDAPTRTALARAQAVYDKYIDDFTSAMWETVEAKSPAVSRQERKRFDHFVHVITGKAKVYQSHPTDFHFPGLPSIEFYDDNLFPWMPEIEARFEDILDELHQELARGLEAFSPYVQLPLGVPVDQWADLNHSQTWTTLPLKARGKVIAENAPRFPKTLAALDILPQPVVPNRSPVAVLSALKPHTRIPPHHGVSNTRLVFHLPLIVPDHCGFRVGSETRPWVPGKAWVFDDTIEHEAWNNSDDLRVILLTDVRNPYVTPYEHDLYAEVLAAIDEFHNEAAAYTEAL
ncbi:MAG: aspartyl beta-hydroxylase [Phenylobacterium zucineum]|nr:MAG: aspartyl beta-hydroxylase [Phenylobacterium zucineum]